MNIKLVMKRWMMWMSRSFRFLPYLWPQSTSLAVLEGMEALWLVAQEESDLKWFQSGKTRGTCIVEHHVLNYVSMCWVRSTYMPPFFCLVPTPLLAEIKMKSDWIVSF